jgi:hypothetical protein
MRALGIEVLDAAPVRASQPLRKEPVIPVPTGTVTGHLPGLAVSLYHRPDHLWKIPLQIRYVSQQYRFYLRYHGYSSFDLVLYGVPRG